MNLKPQTLLISHAKMKIECHGREGFFTTQKKKSLETKKNKKKEEKKKKTKALFFSLLDTLTCPHPNSHIGYHSTPGYALTI